MEIKDHDMLIKVDTRMNLFCQKLDKYGKENREDHKDILKLIEDGNKNNDSFKIACRSGLSDEINKKISATMFKWITGFIIAGLVSLSIYTSDIKLNDIQRSMENKTKIEKILDHMPEVKSHLYKIPDTNLNE